MSAHNKGKRERERERDSNQAFGFKFATALQRIVCRKREKIQLQA